MTGLTSEDYWSALEEYGYPAHEYWTEGQELDELDMLDEESD